MEITLEQARVFETVSRLGTIQSAATELNKAHSAVVYSLKCLENQTGLTLFDRSAHRNRTTPEGDLVLKYCRQLLATREELKGLCRKLKSEWEPSLKLIYDGIIDFNFLGDALFELNELRLPTEIKVLSAHLNEVEARFAQEEADMMVTILPLQRLQIPSFRLKTIRLQLVAHRLHPLGKERGQTPLSNSDLNRHTFIAIKTAPGALGLSTEQMQFDSYFFVNDFSTKKQAIIKRLGFGWLPDYMIQSEIKKGTLRVIKTEIDNTHAVHPRLYHRPDPSNGKTATQLLKIIRRSMQQ